MHLHVEQLNRGALSAEAQIGVMILSMAAASLRQGRKVDKAQLRQAMFEVMHANTGSSKDVERLRGNYLKNEYGTGLEQLPSVDFVVQQVKQLALSLEMDVAQEAGKLTISLRDDAGTDVLALHYGKGAFVKHLAVGGDIRRPVYLKKGTAKHYVEDDNGIMTRRYAYRSMNGAQYQQLRRDGFITGRTPMNAPISERVRSFHKLPEGPPASLAQTIYIHQRYASGDEQRGVCLASTAHNLVSDEGYQFGGDQPVRICVDLARVTGTAFYNLYQNPGAWQGLDFYIRGGKKLTADAATTRVGLLKSMLKNTELFLERLQREWVCQAHSFEADSWSLIYVQLSPNAPQPEDPIEPPVIHGRD